MTGKQSTRKNRTAARICGLLCLSMIVLGTLLRIFAVHQTPYDISAHDLGYIMGPESSETGAGHLGYIEYLFKHRALPDFSPTKIWSFYNPPLYHGISAAVLGLATCGGQSYEAAWESLQFLPCLFVFLAVIGAYLSLKELDLDGMPLLIATALFSFHPTFTYLSVTMNNDPLSLAFSAWAVFFAIRWYKKPTVPDIIGVALCIGLGMMTKLTVALIAPPVAILFLYRFFKDKTWKKTFIQFVVFGLICVPLGLFWSIRNLILYHMPLGYIQSIPWGSSQNISAFSIGERFGLPPLSDFVRPESYWSPSGETGAPDHNLWSQTLRTALFDDNMLTFSAESPGHLLARILMVTALVLAVMTVVLTVLGLTGARQVDPLLRIFIGSAILIPAINFVTFCISNPFTCTIHFRYLATAVPLFAAAVGLWWKYADGTATLTRWIKWSYSVLTVCFCVLSAVLYLNI